MGGDCFSKTHRAGEVKRSTVIYLLRQYNIFAAGGIMSKELHINFIH
jgi:hypothetical protein